MQVKTASTGYDRNSSHILNCHLCSAAEVTAQYRPCDFTKTSLNIYIYIYIYTNISILGPATKHCPENGLNLMRVMECPNDHKISPSSILHLPSTCNSTGYATEC